MIFAGSTSVVQRTPVLSQHAATSTTAAPTTHATSTANTSVTPPANHGPAPASPPVTTVVPAAPAPAPVAITADLIADTNTKTRPSLVNILCSFHTAHTASYISGSGLIIDPRGVVLTNAHVAEYFLLQNYPSAGSSSCAVRIGNPATAAYQATLLYLPPAWIASNASQILSNQPMGTGERDYAFLYITGPAQYAPALPPIFPSLTFSTANPTLNDPVLLAGYPAGFLDANEVQHSLYISSAVSSIHDIFTYASPHDIDLVSLGGTAISQSGSSGGAVISLSSGKLVGLISTESEGTTTASRDLNAITLSYINRNLESDGRGGIAGLLSGDVSVAAQKFNTDTAPTLTKELTGSIDKQLK